MLVAGSLLGVFLAPHDAAHRSAPPGPVAQQRLLRFADRPDGAVVVTDASDGRVVAVITGASGFLRGTLSGLARIRMTQGLGPAIPFRLTSYVNRRLTLSDPATGQTIELEAFGATNEAVFARLLASDAASSADTGDGAEAGPTPGATR